jgi:enterochelin esterase-like enzyme
VPLALSVPAVEALLGRSDDTWWLNGDILTMVARREGEADLCCSIQRRLHPIGHGLQAISVRVPDLERAILDIQAMPNDRQDEVPVWRGPNAPSAPERADAAAVRARTFDHDIQSTRLGERRGFSVYVPEGIPAGERVPVIYMPDGGWPDYYRIADAMARRGAAGPVIMVGIYNAPRPPGPPCFETHCDLRSQELLIDLPGLPPENHRFDGRARFTLEEVIPFVESHYPVRRDPDGRAVLGWSSGGAWALTMGALHPDMFGNVIALSVGWEPAMRLAARLRHGRALFAFGRFEDRDFRERTARAAALARQAGAEVRLLDLPGGHAHSSWELSLVEALAWMFPPRPVP